MRTLFSKPLFVGITIFFVGASAWAGKVELKGGDSMTILANTETTVSCKASPGSGGTSGGHTGSATNPIPGLDAGAQVCGKLYYDADKQSCLAKVNSAYGMSVEAANACGTLYYDNDKVNCLVAIKDKLITPSEAATCGKLYYDADKINCFTNLTRPFPRRR